MLFSASRRHFLFLVRSSLITCQCGCCNRVRVFACSLCFYVYLRVSIASKVTGGIAHDEIIVDSCI